MATRAALVGTATRPAGRGHALAIRRVVDRALIAILTLWAAISVLPVGAWTGIAEGTGNRGTWGLWGSTLLLAGLLTVVLFVLSSGELASFLRGVLRAAVRLRRASFLLITGCVASCEALTVSVCCFGRNPQTIDSWVQYFQARVFLSGRLVAPPPPSIAHFATLHTVIDDRGWFSQFPPVHPALLALGMAVGAAWLVTPLLAGLLPAAAYHLGLRTGDERVARLAAGLTLLSPFVIAMDASAMNHLPAALCVAVGLWALPGVAVGRSSAASVLGLASGLCFGIRPLDAAALALVAIPALWAALEQRCWGALFRLVIAGLIAAVPTFAFNAAATGNPLKFTYFELWGEGLALGFHATPWGQTLTLARAMGLTAMDAHELNVSLLEWPLPVTVIIAAGLWLRRDGLDGLRAPVGYVLALIGLLFFYFYRNTLYGPRFLFSAVPALLVLLAAALVRLGDIDHRLGWRSLTGGDLALGGFVVVAVLAAALLGAERLASYGNAGTALALHPDRDAAEAGIRRAVVLVPEGWGARLVARMWAAGIPMKDSTRLYRAFNACELGERLEAAAAAGVHGPELAARLTADMAGADPGIIALRIVPDPMIRLPSDLRLPPACAAEIEHDRRGTMQFGPYLYLNTPTLDGDVVWAREVGGAADEALRRMLPGREVYRYVFPRKPGEPAFTRVER